MSEHKDPATLDDYNALYQENVRYEGFGLDTAMVHPCPCCAAPDWLNAKVLEVEAALSAGATCKQCGRSVRCVVERTPAGMTLEMVQTGGPDPAPYLPPMRREEAA